MEKKYYSNERSVQIIISLLKQYGIKKVIASPGTTNISLIGSLQQDPFYEMYSSADERSAAYMACGLAEESGEPVVLSCTGATASRNYLPALTEAYYRKLPVLVVTAHVGLHKIGHNIAQVIDRRTPPNDTIRLAVDLPVVRTVSDEWTCEILVNKAINELRHRGGGPVHINYSINNFRDFSVKELPVTRQIKRVSAFDVFPELPNGRIGVFVGSHKRWTSEETKALDSFCACHNGVVFCDHTSGYKGKYRVQFALLGGQKRWETPLKEMDVMIHIGGVSGDYYSLGLRPKQVWRVNEDGEMKDLFRKLRYVFEMPEEYFFRYYAKGNSTDISYFNACRSTYKQVLGQLPELPFSNIWMAQKLAHCLPENAVLHFGILNTLRAWNFFEIPDSVLSYCNVGGFGIDGNLSTLVGASLSNPDKLYFGVLGDLAFFYDMNVAGNHHVGRNLRVMLVNNGRGTEFRNYDHPGRDFGDDADRFIAAAGHYGNKSPLLVKHYSEDLGFEYLTASDKESFNNVYKRFVTPEMTNKPMLFEVFTDSEDESSAVEMIRNYMVDTQVVLKSKAKEGVKSLLGEAGVKAVKKILKK